ncbi:MAG: tetratricopeptide repeat protein [Gemmatimonadota bacterium]|nr:tetratricopeptide repeat protein [Gemmatimonadota bacterium]
MNEQGESHDSKSILEVLAEKAGDPRLFPSEVLRLHADGEPHHARRLLLKHAKTERDSTRAARQREAAAMLRVWISPLKDARAGFTLNGFGTRLLGEYDRDADGTYVKTKWLTALFIPLWPLVSYLVARAEPQKRDVLPGSKPGGWYILGRTPHPSETETGRRFAIGGMAVLVGLIGFTMYRVGSRADLYVYNGFAQPVWAYVGDAIPTVLRPGEHLARRGLSTEPIEVAAAWDGADTRFETLTADLTDLGGDAAVYNIGGRALIAIEYVSYGEGPGGDREPRILEVGPIIPVREATDYEFEIPPDSISTGASGIVTRSWLTAMDDPGNPAAAVMGLSSLGMPERALALARASIEADPNDPALAMITAVTIHPDDVDSQRALLREWIADAPDAVHLHRAYQQLWQDEDRAVVRAEYDSLGNAHPDSPMYRYLAGRTQPEGSRAELDHYLAAVELDPEFAFAYRGLGFRAMRERRWADALEHLDRVSALDPDAALEYLDDRMRLRRMLGRPHENEGVLSDVTAANPAIAFLRYSRAHERVGSNPVLVGPETTALLTYHRNTIGVPISEWFAAGIQATLAVTAGDIEGARAGLSSIDPSSRPVDVTFRLALSEGALPSDLLLLREISDWHRNVAALDLLIGLPLVDPVDREEAIQSLEDADFGDVLGVLEDPNRLLEVRAIANAVEPEQLQLLAHAHFAAAFRLSSSDRPGAARARQAHLQRALLIGLPGELPYMGS